MDDDVAVFAVVDTSDVSRATSLRATTPSAPPERNPRARGSTARLSTASSCTRRRHRGTVRAVSGTSSWIGFEPAWGWSRPGSHTATVPSSYPATSAGAPPSRAGRKPSAITAPSRRPLALGTCSAPCSAPCSASSGARRTRWSFGGASGPSWKRKTSTPDAREPRGGDGGHVAGAVAVRGERAEVIRTGRDGPYRRSWHMNRRVVPGAARHAPAFQGAVAALSENPSGGRVIRTRRVIPARREHADGENAGGGDVRGEHPSGAAEREVPGDHVAVAIAAEVGRRGERVSAGPGGGTWSGARRRVGAEGCAQTPRTPRGGNRRRRRWRTRRTGPRRRGRAGR